MAVGMNGSTVWMAAAGSINYRSLTVCSWFKRVSDTNNYMAVGPQVTENVSDPLKDEEQWGLGAGGDGNGDDVTCYAADNGAYPETSYHDITDGGWHFVAGVWASDGTFTLYAAAIGGTLASVGSDSESTSFTPNGVAMGCQAADTDTIHAGARVWEDELTLTELQAEMDSADYSAVHTTGLWGEWKLPDASTLTDSSGNGNDFSVGAGSLTSELDPYVVEAPIGASTDWGYANPDASSFGDATDFGDCWLGDDTGNQTNVWLAFVLDIPQGAYITAAYITFPGSNVVQDAGSVLAKIQAVAEDDHAIPTSLSAWQTDNGNLTTAAADWDFTAAATSLQTADFASVVQEIVQRGSWASGNTIGIQINDDGSSLAVEALDDDSGITLHVEWQLTATTSNEQEGYRWRDDDDDEANAAWLENQDTVTEQPVDTNVRLRTLIDNTGDYGSVAATLQYKRDDEGSGEWRDV